MGLPNGLLRIHDHLLLAPLTDADHWGARLAERDPWLTLGFTASGLANYLAREDPALSRHVILFHEQETGLVCLRHPWLRGPFLELFAVTRPGQGIGTAVIRHLIHQTGDNLWATVSDFNQPGRRFYRQQGFVEIASLPGLVRSGHQEILLRLVKPSPSGNL